MRSEVVKASRHVPAQGRGGCDLGAQKPRKVPRSLLARESWRRRDADGLCGFVGVRDALLEAEVLRLYMLECAGLGAVKQYSVKLVAALVNWGTLG